MIVGISRNTYYKYTRSEDKPKASKPSPPPQLEQPKVMKVNVWLRVENNSKFVRGKKKVREEIELYVFGRFDMEPGPRSSCEYVLSIPYTTDTELDSIIARDIRSEVYDIAEGRNCFTEMEITALDDSNRSWR